MAIIGFEPVSYSATELDGSVSFSFRVLQGNIALHYRVLFFTSNGTAMSKPSLVITL